MINGIVGILILTLGRKLFWLFVGCVGFVFGLQIADQYLVAQPSWMVWVVALFIGFIGALLALFFQNLAIGLGGFAAGTTIASYLSVLTGFAIHPLINLLGGIIGLIVLYALFDWALICLSSLVGATLIVQATGLTSQAEIVVYVVLIASGILVQTLLWRRQPLKFK
jgi:hypothetical protein